MRGSSLVLSFWPLMQKVCFCPVSFSRHLTLALGKFQYQKAFGPKNPHEAMDLNAAFTFASCTKLMTSIAALQCVERHQIGLDDDVSGVLPELKDLKILTGFEETTEKPILEPARESITLRYVLLSRLLSVMLIMTQIESC
jgi:Beta-lactamase